MDKLVRENFEELRACLAIAFKAFSHDDDGPVWSDSLIARTERVLTATSAPRVDYLSEDPDVVRNRI